MKKIIEVLSLIILSLSFSQCQKEVGYYGEPDGGTITLPQPIKTTVQGNIVDENDQPAPGVSITIGNQTATTNEKGYFRISDVTVDKNTSLVTAVKAGYFKGIRVFAATEGTNQVVIKLMKKDLAGTINASAGGAATLANGAKVSLASNGVVIASTGAAFNGDVKVYATYINPRATDIAQIIPGSFAATDKAGKRVVLQSYGMLAVELESASGEKLQVKEGTVATLTSPISGTVAKAPDNIPLWYVDEQTGLWQEEGTATKQGNNYVGDVTHFSFWNCDYPFDAARLSMKIYSQSNKPLAYTPVKVTAFTGDDSASSAYGYTDSLGVVSGLVPANKDIVVEVIDLCNNPVFTKTFAPRSVNSNTDLGIIMIPTGTSLVTITGTLNNCTGTPVTSGYAIFDYNNRISYAATDGNGVYNTTFLVCSSVPATAIIIGVDQVSQQQSVNTTINVNAPITNAGTLAACGTSAVQFINYTLDGVDYELTSTAADSIIGFTNTDVDIFISGSKKNTPSEYINFRVFNAPAAGTFPLDNLSVSNFGAVALTQPFNITITSYPTVIGEFYEGAFNGQFKDSTAAIHDISSTFKVRREN